MAPSCNDWPLISHYRKGACVHLSRPHPLDRQLGSTETHIDLHAGFPALGCSWHEIRSMEKPLQLPLARLGHEPSMQLDREPSVMGLDPLASWPRAGSTKEPSPRTVSRKESGLIMKRATPIPF